MKALNEWYEGMGKGQKGFVYLVSVALVFVFGIGLGPLALLIYLELGLRDRLAASIATQTPAASVRAQGPE
jgi:hypothetical protein